MSGDEALYDIRERTGNPTHASVKDVYELVCKRAQDPRENHQDAHFDEAMTDILDRHGEKTVRTVIRRILVEHYPFRTATVELDMRNADGVWIVTTAG